MSKGIIYLIQPSELVGSNRYKIGCSKSPDLKRCNTGYKKGSRYICIMECTNPLKLETQIKNKFNNIFTLIAGTEFFEGVECIMTKEFIKIINEYNNNIIITKSCDNSIPNNNNIITKSCNNSIPNNNIITKLCDNTKLNNNIDVNNDNNIACIFICNICNKQYKDRSGLWRHNTKRHTVKKIVSIQQPIQSNPPPVQQVIQSNLIISKQISCKYCQKNFKYKQGKCKHEKKCKEKQQNEYSIYMIHIEKLTQEIEKLKNKL